MGGYTADDIACQRFAVIHLYIFFLNYLIVKNMWTHIRQIFGKF
jgi:uncharacterized membrane protein